ncbi:LURP-one-related/scramblase family protein [Levilactobacillus brevis]|jgi:uncharacterized protein YxjI|uniref:Uncharacterized protein n=2 Tax=Levilactobacillus brevis TaxID=1580 RepID=Q03SK7_LEVBA|nr:hypothetical protein [Levilactobacillus brevis]MBL3536989.1 hypothetical protein [Lactobacillus sp. GPR40-2]MBL3630264.1 hypothetical protein [Lactobacillus sp. GPB7-4]ABJ63815.1 hypothetical protein LVIS_0672 [Levilactobacillus brevis ATCC 367]ARQ93553.1 hypothetical protein A6F60_07500 [Levilactobacillus brevis]ARW21585.1 hypothetical protein S101174_00719 [Levilactobacillus brevis]
MRVLYLNQAALSAKATSVVRDQHNQSRYLLVGKWGLRADVVSVYTIAGSLEAEVKQETLGLLPKFRLLYHRQLVGRVSKTFGVIREVLFVRGLNWIIMGNLNHGHFKIYHGRDLIASIDRVSASGNTVALTVDHPDHEALVICLATILDRWAKHQQRLPNPLKAWAPRTLSPGEVAPSIARQPVKKLAD